MNDILLLTIIYTLIKFYKITSYKEVILLLAAIIAYILIKHKKQIIFFPNKVIGTGRKIHITYICLKLLNKWKKMVSI